MGEEGRQARGLQIVDRAARDHRIRVLQHGLTRGVGRRELAAGQVAVDCDTSAGEVFLVVVDRTQDRERVAVIVPAVQRRATKIAARRAVVIFVAAGCGERVGLQIERLAGDDVDGAADRAFLNPGFGGLVDDCLADDFRRQQRIVERAARSIAGVAAPVGRGDRVAVDQDAVQRGFDAGD